MTTPRRPLLCGSQPACPPRSTCELGLFREAFATFPILLRCRPLLSSPSSRARLRRRRPPNAVATAACPVRASSTCPWMKIRHRRLRSSLRRRPCTRDPGALFPRLARPLQEKRLRLHKRVSSRVRRSKTRRVLTSYRRQRFKCICTSLEFVKCIGEIYLLFAKLTLIAFTD